MTPEPREASSKQSDRLLEIAGLASRYGRIQVLHEVSLEVDAGRLVAIIGSNGAGKTTLMRAISGVQPIHSGRIVFDSRNIENCAPEVRVRAGISQVPEGRQVFAPLSVTDNLRLGAYGRRDDGVPVDMERMFALFPALASKRTELAGNLSGGQQQMVAIARALMARPRLLLLDEPSMGLSPILVSEIFGIISRLRGEGVTILLVEQNAHRALAIADTAYVLESGRITLSGSAADLRKDSAVQRAYLGG